ncbi:hypothetical protein Patl1_03762 [Pistacia atlantica]|uniref:Uncharacterized protein n=1 Tax=Pistacia atlantica TaxID=434234 RepID=A0ACC1BSJ4_9ROSI|nr:hypothetical protein Patl1_03762 [Pistacia atlantica]
MAVCQGFLSRPEKLCPFPYMLFIFYFSLVLLPLNLSTAFKKEEQLPQRERLDKVQGWFTRVEKTESDVDKLITDSSDEVERLCLGGFCYKNYKFASFRFGKRVAQKLEVVSELKEKGREFKEAADQRKDDPMDDQISSELTVGLESKFH